MPALGHQEGPGGEEEEAAEAAAWRMTQLERQAGWRRRRRRVSGGGRGAPEEQGGTSGGAILVPGRNKRVHGGRRGGCDGNDSGHLLVTTSGSLASSASASASASASCGRCSSGSDHEALFSQLSLHLAGRDRPSGPDQFGKKRRPSVDAAAPRKSVDSNQEALGLGDEEEALDPAKHSFSIALKECQNRRFRSESPASPPEGVHGRWRAASLDLNCQGADAPFSSSGLFTAGSSMTKSSAVSARSTSGVFPSPGTPNYRHDDGAAAYQKGWSSERVPLPAKSGRRYVSTSALLPFNNGRTLPSKWEDAEKWIFSPVSGIGRPAGLPPHHRRPKSKSGPLATPFEMGYSCSSASPPMTMFDGGRIRNFPENSPFLTGVLMTERGCCGSVSSGGGSGSEGVGIAVTEGGRGSYCPPADEGVVRPASVPGCSDLLLQSSFSLPGLGDQKPNGTMDAGSMDSPVILRRKDVATQMSPEDSPRSSPKEGLHFSPSPASSPVIEEMQSHFSKLEVRDVQVDDRVTVTRWTKKNASRGSEKGSANVVEWKKKTAESRGSAWEVPETAKSMSKIRREEAKITAWENLQKAKAEAAIRKLEMKLEKKRSSSMDKILNKLKSAQRKAQDMRNAAASRQADQAARPSKILSSFRKAGQMNPLSACFTCRVF